MEFRLAGVFGLFSEQLTDLLAGHYLIEQALSRHNEGVDAWYEAQKREMESQGETDEEFLNFLLTHQKRQAADDYPQLLRAALFGSIYAAAEFFLVRVCRELDQATPGPALADVRGDGIQRARRYLVDVATIQFPDTGEWTDLVVYGFLRNAFAHAQGDLRGNQRLQAIRDLSSRAGTFSIAEDQSSVVLSAEFAPRFLRTIDEFQEDLFNAIG